MATGVETEAWVMLVSSHCKASTKKGSYTDDVANVGFDLVGNELVEFLL